MEVSCHPKIGLLYVKHIAGHQDKDYYTSLKELGLYSLQMRCERYKIIYLWSILEDKAPNISSSDNANLIRVHSSPDSRKGRSIYIQPLKPGRYSNMRFNSLPFSGARLYNCLPKSLRNQTGVSKDCFKSKLDSYLKLITDQPLLRSNNYSRQTSNSIIDVAPK